MSKRNLKLGREWKVLGGTILDKAGRKHLYKMVQEGREFSEDCKIRRKNAREDAEDSANVDSTVV